MYEYKLEVTTGYTQNERTLQDVYFTLYGTEGRSGRITLDNSGINFIASKTRSHTIKANLPLGKLLLVRVENAASSALSEDEWYCSKIVVTTPVGEVILFPCYRWIGREALVELRGGRAMKPFEEVRPLLLHHREQELVTKKELYLWEMTDDKLPHHSTFKDLSEFPDELRFSMSKLNEVLYTKWIIGGELAFKGLVGSTEPWEKVEDIRKIFWSLTKISEYVIGHWKEDDFFGFQFLNATSPNGIERCSELPPNFPVTEEMVKPFLRDGSSLKQEMERGNVFICDQKIMDGIPTRMYDGHTLHVAAGLCLFYMNPENKLMPIAIQLYQQPSEQNPIFLPSDPEADWLLAKLFIKSADLMEHQAIYHLLGTHYLAEVFAIATCRNFPLIHPLYKLLIPHFCYTLHINTVARKSIFGPDGTLSVSSLGYEGIKELMRRGLSRMTYSSLCLPENITARGLESIPNFYYRDDGLKLWDIISSFLRNIVEYYYPSDSDVQNDTELQEWVHEIFTHGFLGNELSGFPARFNTVEEVIKFITMLIFTVTAQHAAHNNGQFDYHSWVLNGSLLLRKPPPTTKGKSSLQTIFETLPNVGETVEFAGMARLLSQKYAKVVLLGQYPEERFDEPAPKQMIQEFQAQLCNLSKEITARNSELKVPYTYLSPDKIENSIAI